MITESWLHSNISDDIISITGYNLFRCDRTNRIGGGVCAYISSAIPCIPIEGLCSPVPSEIEFLSLRLPTLHMFLVCTYIPPGLKVNVLKRISDFFIDMLDTELLKYPNSHIVICGDFNQFDTSIFSQQFSMRNYVSMPTRNNSLLDQIWLSNSLTEFYLDDASVGPPISSSDHNTVILEGKHNTSTHKNITKVWDFRRSNVDMFLYLLSIGLQDFAYRMEGSTVDDMCHDFYCIFQAALSFIPYTYVSFSKNDKPWITPILKDLINKRWNAYRLKNWPLYFHYKVRVKDELTKAKLIWTKKHINSSKNVWKVVNETRGKSNASVFDSLINAYGGIDYFLNCVQQVLKNNFNYEKDNDTGEIQNEVWDINLCPFDIANELRALKLSTAVGSDGIPNRLIRDGALLLSVPIFHIFKRSLSDRVFPACWKSADVILAPKCKSPKITDFRPISLTPVLSKVFEKLVLKHMMPSISELYGSHQFAFRKHGSTDAALIRIHDYVTEYLDKPDVKAVRMTCLDLSKAFDRVLPNLIIKRLKSAGLNGGFVLWIRSYLTARTQRLKLNGVYSSVSIVPSGLPQGSVLGPILFASFMGSLNIDSKSVVVLYADDVTLIEPIFKDSDLPNNLQYIENWMDMNKMSLNLRKSQQLIFKKGTCSTSAEFAYSSIGLNTEIKVLGVTWNADLDWSSHFENILKLASRRLYVIRVLKPYLSRDNLRMVYNSIILSILLYAAPLFVWLPKSLELKLELFHKRAHKIICGKYCECRYFPSILSLREKRACNFLSKCESYPCHPLHEFVPVRMPRTNKLCLPPINTCRRLHSFFPWTSVLMNS